MKLKIWDRIVAALLGIVFALMGVGMMLVLLNILPAARIVGMVEKIQRLGGWKLWVAAAACVAAVLIGLRGVAILFRRRREKGFVLQRTELGDMSISMKALENMIRRCVSVHDEMKLSNVWIHRVRDGVTVELKLLLASGTSIPLVVNALQKQIKQYITSCSGVDVREVRVQVETDIVKRLPEPEPIAMEAPADGKAESGKQRFWQHKEKPETYAEPTEEAILVSTPEPIQGVPVEAEKAEAELSAEAPADEKPEEAKRHFWQRKVKAQAEEAAEDVRPEKAAEANAEAAEPLAPAATGETLAAEAEPAEAPAAEETETTEADEAAMPEEQQPQPETSEPEETAAETPMAEEEYLELQRLYEEQQAANGEVEA